MSVMDLPKVELHLHFEGAAPPAFIRQLAFERKVDLSKIFTADGGYAFENFVHFLQVYEAATSVLQSPEDFARLTEAVLAESAENGAVYSETFLSPDFCGGGDVAAWREYLHAIQEAAERAEARHGIIAARHRHTDPAFRTRERPSARRCVRPRRRATGSSVLAWAATRARATRVISPTALTWRARPGCG